MHFLFGCLFYRTESLYLLSWDSLSSPGGLRPTRVYSPGSAPVKWAFLLVEERFPALSPQRPPQHPVRLVLMLGEL